MVDTVALRLVFACVSRHVRRCWRFGTRANRRPCAALGAGVLAARELPPLGTFTSVVSTQQPAGQPCQSHIVSAAGGRAAAAGPVGVEELAARLVHPLVGVRAKIIALRLEQIRWQDRGTILVVKCQRGAERGMDGSPWTNGLSFTRRVLLNLMHGYHKPTLSRDWEGEVAFTWPKSKIKEWLRS